MKIKNSRIPSVQISVHANHTRPLSITHDFLFTHYEELLYYQKLI
ncbi:hypothetical protein LJPFL01_1189 [Lelliottia jeotgali]|nr:hypothetical protein LJPFL01_1189 [Lelliottia jeotgali]